MCAVSFIQKKGNKFPHRLPGYFVLSYFAIFSIMRQNQQAALGFIFVTLLIDVTGWGIIIPVMPKLIEQLIHGDVSMAARYGGWLNVSYAVMQFIFAPILGNLSDKYGRRPVLLFSLFGFTIDYIFLAFAPTIFWLFVGRCVSGITGASFTTAAAYIADISNENNRAKNFGMIGAAFGLGFIVGPVIGGLLGQLGHVFPFMQLQHYVWLTGCMDILYCRNRWICSTVVNLNGAALVQSVLYGCLPNIPHSAVLSLRYRSYTLQHTQYRATGAFLPFTNFTGLKK